MIRQSLTGWANSSTSSHTGLAHNSSWRGFPVKTGVTPNWSSQGVESRCVLSLLTSITTWTYSSTFWDGLHVVDRQTDIDMCYIHVCLCILISSWWCCWTFTAQAADPFPRTTLIADVKKNLWFKHTLFALFDLKPKKEPPLQQVTTGPTIKYNNPSRFSGENDHICQIHHNVCILWAVLVDSFENCFSYSAP